MKNIFVIFVLSMSLISCGDSNPYSENIGDTTDIDTTGVPSISDFTVTVDNGEKIISVSSYAFMAQIFGENNIGNLSGFEEGGTAIGLAKKKDIKDKLKEFTNEQEPKLVAKVEYIKKIGNGSDSYFIALYHWCAPLDIDEGHEMFWCNNISNSSNQYNELYGLAMFKKFGDRFYLYGNNPCFTGGRDNMPQPSIIQIGKNKLAVNFEGKSWGGTGGNVSLSQHIIILDRNMSHSSFETSFQSYDDVTKRLFQICYSDQNVFSINLVNVKSGEVDIYMYNDEKFSYENSSLKKINDSMIDYDRNYDRQYELWMSR